MLHCNCSVRSLATLTKMIRTRSVSQSSSRCILSSCFTCAVHSSCRCSTTARMRRHIIGWLLCQNSESTIFAARCYASAAYAVMCLCVRPAVAYMDSVKTNNIYSDSFHCRVSKKNQIKFNCFSSLYSYTILVFLYQMSWQYSDGDLPSFHRGH